MAGAGVSRPLPAVAVLAAGGVALLVGSLWWRAPGGSEAVQAPAGHGAVAAGPVPGAMDSAATAAAVPPDAGSRARLMQRYAGELDEDARGAVLAELLRDPDAALRDFALGLVTGADAGTRLRGYELLAAFPLEDAAVRGAMLAGLGNERDPMVLARVAGLVVPTVLPSSQAAPIADALQALAAHADPDVRAQGVLQAAQWAAPGEAEPLLARALLDDSPEVRKAGIAGAIATRALSPQLKDALLWIAGDAASDPEQRAAAVFALQWYRLDDAEYAIYRQAEAAGADAHPGTR